MLILRLQPFNLDPGDIHESTIWQVAEDTPDFTNIVAETQEDSDNLFIKIFNFQAVPGKKYYARARTVSQNAGLSVWSNVDMDISVDTTDEIARNLEPKRIKPPTFDLKYNLDQFPYAGFKLNLVPQELNSATGHVSTSWYIKNLRNEVIFASRYDEHNLYEIFIDIVLEEGEIYILEAQYHYRNNDNSMVSGITVTTSKSFFTKFRKKETLNDGSVVGTYNEGTTYLRAEIIIPASASDSIIEIYKDGELIDSVHDTIYETDSPQYGEDGFIIVRAKSIMPNPPEDEWVYYIFSLTNNYSGFAYNFPAEIG